MRNCSKGYVFVDCGSGSGSAADDETDSALC
jgi:hypothetical protein